MIPTRQLAEHTKDQIVSPSAGRSLLPVGHRRLLLSLFPHLCISQPPSRKPTDSCLTASVASQAVGIFPYCVFFFSCVRRACSSPAPVELVNLCRRFSSLTAIQACTIWGKLHPSALWMILIFLWSGSALQRLTKLGKDPLKGMSNLKNYNAPCCAYNGQDMMLDPGVELGLHGSPLHAQELVTMQHWTASRNEELWPLHVTDKCTTGTTRSPPKVLINMGTSSPTVWPEHLNDSALSTEWAVQSLPQPQFSMEQLRMIFTLTCFSW